MAKEQELMKKKQKADFYEHGQFMGSERQTHNRAARIQMRGAFMPDIRGPQQKIQKGQHKQKSNVVYPDEQGGE